MYNFLWNIRFFFFGYGLAGLILDMFLTSRFPFMVTVDLLIFGFACFLIYSGRKDEEHQGV